MSRIEKSLEEAVKARQTALRAKAHEAGSPAEIYTEDTKFRPAEIPVVKDEDVDGRIACIREPNSYVAEQFRKLRARIKAAPGGAPRSIMITSSGIGEGKTVTSVNLAAALANELDNTVLLVDTDLRNPMVHKYLGLLPKAGLSDYLKGVVELKDVLIKTGIGRLVVLPAGNVPENPSELLSSMRMAALAEELKQRYSDRYVIYDSSPLLATADSVTLARHMDGILFVMSAGRTPNKSAQRAMQLLKGHRVLGVVFNNVQEQLARSMYPYPYELAGAHANGKKAGTPDGAGNGADVK